MDIDIEELRTTATLAHLNMEESELTAAFPAFRQMVGFFTAMQNADNDEAAFGVSIAALSAEGEAMQSKFFREDKALAAISDAEKLPLNENLLANSPQRDGRFVVVPNVL
ncbi:MAG: hypothetical protein Ta2B_06800 [Termitinemataceae bacterium]|nr:MAG: hypothetical protein Ta2B_06800 [Termitinemataceae bacterium]